MSRALIIIAIVVGLPLVALIALMLLLDNPDVYKSRLSSTFQEQTGLGLVIDGDISWRYMPPIAINISDISITTPASELPLASLKTASIDLKLLPLIFGGSVEVDGLAIDGLTVNAEVDTKGVGNWEIKSSAKTSSAAKPATTNPETTNPSSTEASSSADNFKLDISSTSFTNAKVNYSDPTNSADYELDIEDITTGPLISGELTTIYAHINVADKVSLIAAKVSLAGNFSINEGLDIFSLKNLVVESVAFSPDMPEIKSTLTLNGKINTTAGTAQLTDSSLEMASMKALFNMDVTELFATPGLRGDISIGTFNARELLSKLDADLDETVNSNTFTKVSLSADIKGTIDRVLLSNLSAVLDDSKITGRATIAIKPRTSLDFALKLDNIVASDYMAPTAQTSDKKRG